MKYPFDFVQCFEWFDVWLKINATIEFDVNIYRLEHLMKIDVNR